MNPDAPNPAERSIRVEHGDCRAVLAALAAEGVLVDSVVTDPPYHLTSIVKRFGKKGSAPAKSGATGAYARAARGFMGKQWDGAQDDGKMVAFDPDTWRLVFAVMKPGAHLLAFGGTRTFHRMACAIEDAGFEIRDTIMWLYGTGFPKSHDVPPFCRIETRQEFDGWGTALKPACEPITVARKPLPEKTTVAANVLKHGTGALNVDGCRVETPDDLNGGAYAVDGAERADDWGKRNGFRRDKGIEFVQPEGRWPANVVHDGSDEVAAAFDVAGDRHGGGHVRHREAPKSKNVFGDLGCPDEAFQGYPDSGSAARFFYSAKADAGDRFGSKHPTVKPVDLIRWLCRLVTPPGGVVLDPFAGSGTAGVAALAEGFGAVLIEADPESVADIAERLAFFRGEGRHSLASKQRNADPDKRAGADTPLFGSLATLSSGEAGSGEGGPPAAGD